MIILEKENKKRYRIQFSLTKDLNDRYRECRDITKKLDLYINMLEEFEYWFDEILYKIEYELRYYHNDYDKKMISSVKESGNIG